MSPVRSHNLAIPCRLCLHLFKRAINTDQLAGAINTRYTTVYTTPPWGGFPSLPDKSRGCQHRTIRLRNPALGQMLSNDDLFRTGTIPKCGDIDHGTSARRVVSYTPSYTVPYLVKGSTLSLLPKICAVEAVGMGATRREFLRPCSAILAFRPSQSCLSVGFTPQRSNWRRPSEAGDPA